jgi:hypothetical protein
MDIDAFRLRQNYVPIRKSAFIIDFRIDEIVKSHFNDWIPACAGMT